MDNIKKIYIKKINIHTYICILSGKLMEYCTFVYKYNFQPLLQFLREIYTSMNNLYKLLKELTSTLSHANKYP